MRRDRRTLNLFDWEPPVVARAFDAVRVRAVSLYSAISKAVSLAMKECGKPRKRIAHEISEYLGRDCPESMLNAYASEGREDHSISLVRFIALIHVTRDMRLLNMIAKMFGWAVIDERYLAAVEEAMWADQEERATRERLAARRRWKGQP